MLAQVFEVDPGAGDKFRDGARDENLAGLGPGRDAGRNVNGDAGEVVTAKHTLTGVESRPDLDPFPAKRLRCG